MTASHHRKIVTPEDLAQAVREAQDSGRKVVHCHGCFDIVHPGHLRYLQFAREQGDILIVSLTGDQGINKGVDRPYIPQELRAENLAALEIVDWVTIDSHTTAAELLERVRPDIYIKGHEYANATDPRFQREREIIEQHGGRVIFHSGDIVFSSTRLIDTLQSNATLEEVRLRATCHRHGITPQRVREQIERLGTLRAIVIGDVVQEHYTICDPTGPGRHSAAPAYQQVGRRSFWGGATLVADQLSEFGLRTSLVTALPQNTFIELSGARPKLSVTNLAQLATLPSCTSIVADDSKLFEITSGSFTPLDSEQLARAITTVRAQVAEADLVIWCDYGYGLISPALVEAVQSHPRRAGLTLAGYAPGMRSQMLEWAGLDVAFFSERRLRELIGDMSGGLSSVAYELLSCIHGQRALVSLHKRGHIAFDGRGERQSPVSVPERLKSDFIPSFARHSFDLHGAAETSLAIASAALACNASLPLATYLAAVAEAANVAKPGGEGVTVDDFHLQLSRRPEMWPDGHFIPDPLPALPQAEPATLDPAWIQSSAL
jgi:rfaE bifunctional protein nucleotidyltransferase chain/domain